MFPVTNERLKGLPSAELVIGEQGTKGGGNGGTLADVRGGRTVGVKTDTGAVPETDVVPEEGEMVCYGTLDEKSE